MDCCDDKKKDGEKMSCQELIARCALFQACCSDSCRPEEKKDKEAGGK